MQPPAAAVGRGRAGEALSRLGGGARRHRPGRSVEDDRVARDAVGIGRTAESELDRGIARPGRHRVARRGDHQTGRCRRVHEIGTARRHRAQIPRPVHRTDVRVPDAVGEAPRAAREAGGRRAQVTARRRCRRRCEAVAIDCYSRETVACRAPRDLDRRIRLRLPVTVRERAHHSGRRRWRGVDPERAGVDGRGAVARHVARPQVEVPVVALGELRTRGRVGVGGMWHIHHRVRRRDRGVVPLERVAGKA